MPDAIAVIPFLAPAATVSEDVSSFVVSRVISYVMDVQTPSGAVRIPISSWQATLRAEQQSYIQAVVPACGPWIDTLTAGTSFSIKRVAGAVGAGAVEVELASGPLEQRRYDRGPQNYTATISGYSSQVAAAGAVSFTYPLTAVRSTSVDDGGRRARCAIDWQLRPGNTALLDGVPFVVGYINYYVTSSGDAYMDVGQQGA